MLRFLVFYLYFDLFCASIFILVYFIMCACKESVKDLLVLFVLSTVHY